MLLETLMAKRMITFLRSWVIINEYSNENAVT